MGERYVVVRMDYETGVTGAVGPFRARTLATAWAERMLEGEDPRLMSDEWHVTRLFGQDEA